MEPSLFTTRVHFTTCRTVQLVGRQGQLDNETFALYNQGFNSPQAKLSSLWGDKVSWTMKPSLCTTKASLHHRPDFPIWTAQHLKTLGQLDDGTFAFYNQGFTSPQA
ncbi:hypothetical protein RRG08_043789 [Elysia crispata]|uniref:Uncharacterized protein n=1 Tax=Elysia crispata TaxID=231223 RepID=A0AAE0Z5M3_9GAST|nr:hypothetical protein RRG08_043789 [Elysia crispata]